MRKGICLILLVGLLATSLIAIVGCGEDACQKVGAYEECLQRGDAVCADIYPKCPEHGEVVINGDTFDIECEAWQVGSFKRQDCEVVRTAYSMYEDGWTVKGKITRTLIK